MWKLNLVDVSTGRALEPSLRVMMVPRHAETVVLSAMSDGKVVHKWVVARVEWELDDETATLYLAPVPGGE
jgi:hypothetical protein